MKLKIHGGTPQHGAGPLCHTCKFATIVHGQRATDEVIRCGVLRQRIVFPVTFCTQFVDRQHPAIYEMEEMAWILRTDAQRKQIGFVHAKKLTWNERHVLDDE